MLLFSCFVIVKANPMELMMYIGNDLIESVPLLSDKISQPGYLGQFKRELKTRYAELLRQVNGIPEFFVMDMSPRLSASC